MSVLESDRRIRALRPPRPAVDPFVAHGSIVDEERRPDGHLERALTVFLAGAECPFTCAFCDLWRYTIDGPTPSGALPRQLRTVLDALDGPLPERIKLYNASNFFDKRAVPPSDVPAIAEVVRPFAGVTVESHANTVGPSTLSFNEQVEGRLEVAIGLETIHPEAMRHLNKRLDLDGFDHAARLLADNEIDLRVFVLLGAPYVAVDENVEWTVRTVRHAVERGAAVVSIIPVRGGNGEMERLAAEGRFIPPALPHLEEALDACVGLGRTVVTADLWDVEQLPGCSSCAPRRIERLRRMNVSGRTEARVVCDACHPEGAQRPKDLASAHQGQILR